MSSQETGLFIANLRKEAGITQQELAQKLNVTAKAISRWETGLSIVKEIIKIHAYKTYVALSCNTIYC